MADLYTNRMGSVLVVAPSSEGRLAALVRTRNVVFRLGGTKQSGVVRWVFADVPHETLTDEWGNTYDHQVHSLLSGDLAEGEEFLRELKAQGFEVAQKDKMFVPLQTLDPNDQDSSDRLRFVHPRAFALASRHRTTPTQLVTTLRDRALFGD